MHEAEVLVSRVAEPILRAHGFGRDRKLVFTRAKSDRVDRIGLSVFQDRMGHLRASLAAGIRFPAVEAIRGPERLPNDAPTIATPMHFLSPDRAYFDWLIDDETEGTELAANIRSEIEEHVLPFLEAYGSLSVVKSALERDDPGAWFTLDAAQREQLLALIDAAQGEGHRAIARLGATIERLESAPMKRRYPLLRLRDHLTSLLSIRRQP